MPENMWHVPIYLNGVSRSRSKFESLENKVNFDHKVNQVSSKPYQEIEKDVLNQLARLVW